MTGEIRIQRISQACHNCRRKKIRCSGTKPACDFCKRVSRDCSYSDTEHDGRPAKRHRDSMSEDFSSWKETIERVDVCNAEAEMGQRWAGVEAKMSEMARSMDRLAAAIEAQVAETKSPTHHPPPSPPPPPPGFAEKGKVIMMTPETRCRPSPSINITPHSGLPSLDTVMAAADIYFRCCHNKPYSLFHEDSFKAKLAMGQLPHHLVFAILASAARHSTHIFRNNKEALAIYSMESWKALVLPWNEIEDRISINIVQTILLLAIIDYTDGKSQCAWLKVGLGIRIIQDFGLMREPDPHLPVEEQEERRRIFWSFYVCDKLMSCGREKPLAMLDENCKVNLPCDECEFRSGTPPWSKTPTLHETTQDVNYADITDAALLSPFSMLVKMASILGQCTHYTLGELATSTPGGLVPWSPMSTLSTINSALFQVESDFGFNSTFQDILQQQCLSADGSIDGHTAAPLLFARTIFHLCHCLLCHPIVYRSRLFSHRGRAPFSFLVHAMDACRSHAQSLITLVREIKEMNCPTLSPLFDPFYGYCITVAGSIHSLFTYSDDPTVVDEAQVYLNSCFKLLDELSVLWKNSGFMGTRLKALHSNSARFAPFLDPHSHTDELTQIDITDALEALDYGLLSKPPSNLPGDGCSVVNLPDPIYDDFLNLFPLGYTRPFENPMPNDLGSFSNELLNPCPESQTTLEAFNL